LTENLEQSTVLEFTHYLGTDSVCLKPLVQRTSQRGVLRREQKRRSI
jgi:hypothetical protein